MGVLAPSQKCDSLGQRPARLAHALNIPVPACQRQIPSAGLIELCEKDLSDAEVATAEAVAGPDKDADATSSSKTKANVSSRRAFTRGATNQMERATAIFRDVVVCPLMHDGAAQADHPFAFTETTSDS